MPGTQYAEKQWETEVKRLYDGGESDNLYINFRRANLRVNKRNTDFDGRNWEIPK